LVRPRHFTDDEMLDVARACFIAHGPGVSTTVIADAAGVSQATLFKRFGTKQELMEEALRPRRPVALLARLAAGPDTRPIDVQLHEIGLQLQALFDRVLPCAMAMWASGTPPSTVFRDPEQAPPVLTRRALSTFIRRAQEQGRMAGGDPEALAMQFIGATKELVFQRHIFRDAIPSADPEAYVSTLIQAFWAGCAPAGER
jgi:AcrR family transcriptional regulator